MSDNPTAIIHMGARFKAAQGAADQVPEPTIAISEGKPSSQYRLVNEIDLFDSQGNLIAAIKSRLGKPRQFAGHDVHCWIEIYGARMETR